MKPTVSYKAGMHSNASLSTAASQKTKKNLFYLVTAFNPKLNQFICRKQIEVSAAVINVKCGTGSK
jgi:hypothetical protein